MVYLGPSLHSPKGALGLNPVWALYARSLPFLSEFVCSLSRLMRATQAQCNQEGKVAIEEKKRQSYNNNKFWGE